MIIAIDGPAASGKGTLAKRLARHFGLPQLDTGALYRAVALSVIGGNLPPDDERAAELAAKSLDPLLLDDPRLRSAAMGEAASKVAAMPGVRAALLVFQRDFARRPGGALLDGRDIGTVICPNADVKLFVTASPGTRAERRFRESQARGETTDFDEILADIQRRDARDAGRSAAPLIKAADAHLLDTTRMDIEQAFQAALAIVQGRLA